MNMHTYIGSQMIVATSMTRGEYIRYVGVDLPTIENHDDEGYLVEYMSQEPNHINHDGHISWRPKHPFESSHIDLGLIDDRPAYQQRVIGECAQLRLKLRNLQQFLDNAASMCLSKKENNLLKLQKESMECYLSILNHRIDDFY